MNFLSTALQSGSVVLREGLEAMLIIAALSAFLRKAGALPSLTALYAGALAAFAASFAAAAVFELFFNGAHNDAVEAVVMVIAAGLMFYMSGWLFLKQDPRSWSADIQRAADRALSRSTNVGLGLIAFLAVFREGGETILFLHALARSAGGWSAGLAGGIVAALVLLAVLFVIMQRTSLRLPLRPVFLFTSAFLFVMGLRFVAGAIQELQEQQLVSYTDIGLPGWLAELVANPTLESVGVQGVIVLAAVLGLVPMALMRQRSGQDAAGA